MQVPNLFETRLVAPVWLALGALYLLFTVTFASYSVNNDGQVYLDFMRRLTGESGPAAPTHQFGGAIFTLPFFLVARILGLAGLHTIGGAPLEQLSMVAATTVALLLIVWLGWMLLRKLDLPATPAVLALTVLGSPLFYYAVFSPTYKHVIDTLYILAAVVLLLRALERPSLLVYAGLGACLGLCVLTRTANAALVPGLLLPLLWRRNWRGAALALGTTAAVVVLLFGVSKASTQLAVVRAGNVATIDLVVVDANTHNFYLCRNRSANLTFKQCIHDVFGIWPDATAPFKMLFSLHRGLFLWTPLTALAVVGFVLLVMRMREQRQFLIGLSVAALGLWFVHALWGDFWDGGFSFSARFLTGLFPVFLLGAAELVRRWRVPALTLLSVCAAFSLLLAFTFETGFKGISRHTGVDTMVRLYTSGERTPQQLVRKLGVQARGRWLGH